LGNGYVDEAEEASKREKAVRIEESTSENQNRNVNEKAKQARSRKERVVDIYRILIVLTCSGRKENPCIKL
jgi:hypothetical protein